MLAERYLPRSVYPGQQMPPWRLEGPEHPAHLFAGQLERCGWNILTITWPTASTGEHYAQAKEHGVFEFIAQKSGSEDLCRRAFRSTIRPNFWTRYSRNTRSWISCSCRSIHLDWNSPAVQARRCYEIARAHAKPIL